MKDEIVDYVEQFASSFHPPIREGVEVNSVKQEGGFFVVETSIGIWHCDDVVCAIGSFHTPYIPNGAEKIPSSIQQIIATDYKNPKQIVEGEVLIVGSGQSGCQIAEDLHLAGRSVHLCLGNAPRSPRKYRGRDSVAWLDEMGYYETTYEENPKKANARSSTNHYLTGRDGGREIDLRVFATEGMRLYGFVEEIDNQGFTTRADIAEKLDAADRSYNGIRDRIDNYISEQKIDAPCEAPYERCWQPPEKEETSLNFSEHNITSIIWCVGFHPNFNFIQSEVFNMRGFPEHNRGITDVRGLYFLGLPWLHTWGSSRFSGIAQDAEHISNHIAGYSKQEQFTESEPFCALLEPVSPISLNLQKNSDAL